MEKCVAIESENLRTDGEEEEEEISDPFIVTGWNIEEFGGSKPSCMMHDSEV